MAEESTTTQPTYSDADKARARQWFKKAADCRERREYDYAIECFITGLSFWPEAVEEGHMPLASVAIQRQQLGGRKPGMMEQMKKPTSGKDAKQAMLNAEFLLSKDREGASYMDALLKNAARGGFVETLKWIAPRVLESLRRDSKPNLSRFRTFRQNLCEAADVADQSGDAATAAALYDVAAQSLDFLVARNPGDAALRDEQRDVSGRLTIVRGKYSEADSFRESLHDADSQRLLHDSERVQQSEQSHEQVIIAARDEYQRNPTVTNMNVLADLLLKRDVQREEDEAIDVLTRAYESSRNYSLKTRADDVRIKQLRRQARELRIQHRESGSEEDRQQVRLAEMELNQFELEVFRERVQKYPTDLAVKFRLGEALFRAGEFDEAIPMLQAAQHDPRSRPRCRLLIGRAFFEKSNAAQAVDELRDALGEHESPTDDLGKELLYWLARALEAGQPAEAKAAYGRLLRMDYNYRNGDARQRMESL